MGLKNQLIISMVLITTVHASDGQHSKDEVASSEILPTPSIIGGDPRQSKSVLSLDELNAGMKKIKEEMGQLTRWAAGEQGDLSDLSNFGMPEGASTSRSKPGGLDQAVDKLWRLVALQEEQIKNQNARIIALENGRGDSHSPPYATDPSIERKDSHDKWLESSAWRHMNTNMEYSADRSVSLPNLLNRSSSGFEDE